MIDLRQAYLQIEIDEPSRKYLTINTHRGLYQYQRLPYGIASEQAIWRRAMDRSCKASHIIVTGKTLEEHLNTLDKVLMRLEEYGVKVNKTKCNFLQTSVEYLGHVISDEGLTQSPTKVEAIVQYYSRFIQNLSIMLAPLHHLLKKGITWSWTGK